MKKVAIMAMAIMLVAGLAYGQTPMKMAGYVNAGVNMPMGPDEFKDYFGMGFNGGVGFGIQPHEMFEIVGRFTYISFGLDEDGVIENAEAFFGEPIPAGVTIDKIDGSLTGFEILADVKFFPMAKNPSPFKFYLLGSLGFTNAKPGEVTIEYTEDGASGTETMPEGESETDISFGGGAGFDYAVSPKVTVFAQAKYMMISQEVDDIKHLPIQVGVKMFFGN